MKKTHFALFFLLLFYLGNAFTKKMWLPENGRALVWDGFGYYFYLPTLFYDDFSTFEKYDYIQEKYTPTGGGNLGLKQAENGNRLMRYPIGCSFLFAPAFIVAHFIAKSGNYPLDGLSLPYQLTMNLWTLLFGMFGLYTTANLLRRYFSDTVVASSILLIGMGTNFFIYAAYSQMHSHIYLFTLYALILNLTDSFYRSIEKKYWRVVLIGLLCGIATACRPTEIICALIPLLWGVQDLETLKERVGFLTANFKISILFVAFACLGAFPQLIYWKIYSGHWLFYSYEDDQTFSFLKPHLIDFLFSYRKGWLTYTPLMYIAVIGFWAVWKNQRTLFLVLLSFFLLNLYLISSWDCWWYGGSFSQRAIIQCYALLLFPFSSFIDSILRHRKYWIPTAIFMVFCSSLNLFMTYQTIYGKNVMESDAMTRSYFWRIFGKTSVTKYDRMMLDTDEQIKPVVAKNLIKMNGTALMEQLSNDSSEIFENRGGIKLSEQIQNSPKAKFKIPKNAKWIRASAKFYYPTEEWNNWKWTQFHMRFINKKGVVKDRSIRCQRIVTPRSWGEIFVDILNEQSKDFDKIEVGFWNANSNTTVYIKDVELSYIKYN